MRSSNWEDARNFHFLMIVQIIAVPPTQAAMTISTVNVVRVILAADEVGADEVVADAADAGVVIVTLAIDEALLTGEEAGMTTGVWEVGREETLAAGVDDGDDDNERTEDTVAETEVLVAVAVFVRELTMPLLFNGSLAEADDEEAAEAVLEGVDV
jgi:hypothetical protein